MNTELRNKFFVATVEYKVSKLIGWFTIQILLFHKHTLKVCYFVFFSPASLLWFASIVWAIKRHSNVCNTSTLQGEPDLYTLCNALDCLSIVYCLCSKGTWKSVCGILISWGIAVWLPITLYIMHCWEILRLIFKFIDKKLHQFRLRCIPLRRTTLNGSNTFPKVCDSLHMCAI